MSISKCYTPQSFSKSGQVNRPQVVRNVWVLAVYSAVWIGMVYELKAAPSPRDINDYAKQNGFPNSLYPYYEKPNKCGGEGATSIVPDKYEIRSNIPAPTLLDPFKISRYLQSRLLSCLR
jgi:hypothetical protein